MSQRAPDTSQTGLIRLLRPREIAVFGGEPAAEVVRRCRALGFPGEIWPVHPHRTHLGGEPCFRSVAGLPRPPDASFVAVPGTGTVEIVDALALRGAGGVVCYASGFAEVGGPGVQLQQRLTAAAKHMAMLGPNCYGMLNYLDGVALWPDQHGGRPVDRGVALLSQSGNVGLNLTMQTRGLPLAMLITVGNQAGSGLDVWVDALLDDARITAIGLHLESLPDPVAFSRVALRALRQGVPLVALKAGRSSLGARITLSHTSSLAGPDAAYKAFFRRHGIAQVHDLPTFLETLKIVHVHGGLKGCRVVSASCSGGEASLVADLAQDRGLELPELPTPVRHRLHRTLGDRVHLTNPLDYHTYIWGDSEAQKACFSAILDCDFDAHLLVLDFPRQDRCSDASWRVTLDAFVQASSGRAQAAMVISSLPEGLPESVALDLMVSGVVPLQGLGDGLAAIAAASVIGLVRQQVPHPGPIGSFPRIAEARHQVLDEVSSKQVLVACGIPVPTGVVVGPEAVVEGAQRLGFPVVLKAMRDDLVHKTEAGAVAVDLRDVPQLHAAISRMAGLTDRFLVERMVTGGVAEMIVGLQRDPQFGVTLTVGAGGILVDVLRDAVTLLLPITPPEVLQALSKLQVWPVLQGWRGRPGADTSALVDLIMKVAQWGLDHGDRLLELDINPVLVMPRGQGVVALDAWMRLAERGQDT